MTDQANQLRVRSGRVFVGIFLLVIGILLLFNRAGVLTVNLLAIIGGISLIVGGERAIIGYATSEHKKLFWGTFLFLSGLLMLLVNFEVVPEGWDALWPSVLIIPGLSFLMLYFSRPKEVLFLVISIISVLAGWGGLVASRGSYDLVGRLSTLLKIFIPLSVIFVGMYLLWKNFLKKRT